MDNLKKIGDYDVVKVLGEGGFGKVFLVKKDGVQYALKVYTRKGLKDMNHEYNISNVVTPIKSKMKCPPSIACSVDKGSFTFNNTDHYYLVMEFIKGYSLTEYIDKIKKINKTISSISNGNCLIKFAYHILKGIEYLHARRAAHNDIKPENIIFNKSQLKLIDLGFGCVLDNNKYVNPLSCSNLSFAGTEFYMSPDLYSLYYNKIPYDIEIFTKNDIWCFGMTLAELCDYEFYSDRLGDRVYQYQYERGKFPYIPEPKKGAKIPIAIKDIITDCLHFNYKQRPRAENIINILDNL